MISFSICVYKNHHCVFLLRPPIWAYFADPFVLRIKEDKVHILVEVYRRFQRKGEICLLTVDFMNRSYRIDQLITEKYHLSYPCVISSSVGDFVMPESESASLQYLYKLEWKHDNLCAHKIAVLHGKYVDLTVRLHKEEGYIAQFYNGTSNANGFLFETKLILDGSNLIHLGEELRVKGRRRPGGLIVGSGPQPYQRSGDDYGNGLDFVNELEQLISPEVLGLPQIFCSVQHRSHHISQINSLIAFDLKEAVIPRLSSRGFFGTAEQINELIHEQ